MKWTFGSQKLGKSLGYILDVSEADPGGSFVRARQRSRKGFTSAQIRMMSLRCSHKRRSVKKLRVVKPGICVEIVRLLSVFDA